MLAPRKESGEDPGRAAGKDQQEQDVPILKDLVRYHKALDGGESERLGKSPKWSR